MGLTIVILWQFWTLTFLWIIASWGEKKPKPKKQPEAHFIALLVDIYIQASIHFLPVRFNIHATITPSLTFKTKVMQGLYLTHLQYYECSLKLLEF
jgi:hypothetical protein